MAGSQLGDLQQEEWQAACASWRVTLLPILIKENLYRQFHLDEPWDMRAQQEDFDITVKVYRSGHEDGPALHIVCSWARTLFLSAAQLAIGGNNGAELFFEARVVVARGAGLAGAIWRRERCWELADWRQAAAE